MQQEKNKPNILVSACLLGNKVRYDGKSNIAPLSKMLVNYFNVIPICPEVDSGMETPREPSEINSSGMVVTKSGKDVTSCFAKGAEIALSIAKRYNVKTAILKDRSPSCGSKFIHDGHFNNTVISGQGKTCELLIKNGIDVIPETLLQPFLDSLNRIKDENK